MLYVDAYIENLFQRFSNWSQINFDKHCYWWLYILTHVLGIECLILFGLKLLEVEHWTFVEFYNQIGIQEIILLLLAFVELLRIPLLKSRIKATMSHQPVMPLWFIKAFRLTCIIFGFGNAILLDPWCVMGFTLASISYFETCKPLPPQYRHTSVQRHAHEATST